MENKNICPGCLAEGFDGYSPTVLRKMFGGKKVSPILPYKSPSAEKKQLLFFENRSQISISGYQEKYSMILEKNILRLTRKGERGFFILKPVPQLPKNNEFAPANEHLTMQIAKQIYKLETAENALVFFKNRVPAYLTCRFDINKKGEKLAVEDFTSLMGKIPASHGDSFKYTGNYLELFETIKTFLPAWRSETPKLFKLIVFNYLFSNGDAHLKNFSIIETGQGDFKLSPAYDLICTKIHIEDSDFALEEGLLPKSISKGKVLYQFKLLAEKAEIPEKVVHKILAEMVSHENEVENLISRSFLSSQLKRSYLQLYQRKLKKLKE